MNKTSFIMISIMIVGGSLKAKSLPYSSRIKRYAFKDPSHHWPKAVVYYKIDKTFSKNETYAILSAMKEIRSVSCIRFKKRKTQEAFVDIIPGEGCSAVVGYLGHRQELTLGKGCFMKKTIQHELFHTLGFLHETEPAHRDPAIHILMQNGRRPKAHYFWNTYKNDVTTFDLPYDSKSVMNHNVQGLRQWNGQKAIGGDTKLSEIDVLKLNKLYSCVKGNH